MTDGCPGGFLLLAICYALERLGLTHTCRFIDWRNTMPHHRRAARDEEKTDAERAGEIQ